jgi:hypothetical protein
MAYITIEDSKKHQAVIQVIETAWPDEEELMKKYGYPCPFLWKSLTPGALRIPSNLTNVKHGTTSGTSITKTALGLQIFWSRNIIFYYVNEQGARVHCFECAGLEQWILIVPTIGDGGVGQVFPLAESYLIAGEMTWKKLG